MRSRKRRPLRTGPQDKLLPRLALVLFERSRTMALLWLVVFVFGILSYTTLLKREGFPSISIPYSLVNGAYLVDDPARVDKEITKPLSDLILKEENVSTVQATARANFFNVAVQYKEGTDPEAASKQIQRLVESAKVLPVQVQPTYTPIKFGFTARGDDQVIAVYDTLGAATTSELTGRADALASFIRDKKIPEVKTVSTITPYATSVDPLTGQQAQIEQNFDRFGIRKDGKNTFYASVSVGIERTKNADIIALDDAVRDAVREFNAKQQDGVVATVSGELATQIKDQIDELQRALLEGLLAVLIIGSLVIAIRASIITVISMATVLAITIGLLYLIGYSLNTITLFSLILALGLIVDDTIIMVEALDAQRKRQKTPKAVVQEATRRVSRAMIAATSTAALSFAPLLFVGGILGGFIRAIPVTIISALLISLAVALLFIPLFAKYLLLGKKQMGEGGVTEVAAGIEARIARTIARPMLWAQHSRKRLVSVGTVAVLIGFMFVGAGGWLFQKVTFNIFPPTKDTNGLIVNMQFAPGTTLDQAKQVAARADAAVGEHLGTNFVKTQYYATGTVQNADAYIDIISYKERDVRSPQLVEQLNDKFENFEGAQIRVAQQDVGPPGSAFSVRVQTDSREAAFKLATDINGFLQDRQLTRPSGEKATIIRTSITDPGTYQRDNGTQYIAVSAEFDGNDTTTLVTLAENAVREQFNDQRIKSYGIDPSAITYDFGQESENQDSFKTLALAFPALLVVIYLLLAIQFRSLLQPLLIFLAIPFSLFGITLGLYLSDNAFSFFAMLGFFALIGLSIKNTILLTDFANQSRRRGNDAVHAAVEALEERFRPLIATSLTAVVSLIPLAILSPFWEGLALVLIGGLLSSTFLVVTVFPYYYLGAEFLRSRVSRKRAIGTLLILIALSVGGGMIWGGLGAGIGALLAVVATIVIGRMRRA